MSSSRRSSTSASVLWAALLAGGLAGCSGQVVGQVRGKVTFRNAPVGEGLITFVNPTTGFAAEAKLAKDGSYVIENRQGGLVAGDYVVTVNPPVYLDRSDPKTPPSPVEKAVANIPPKYRNQGSPLKATVKRGENTFDFELTP